MHNKRQINNTRSEVIAIFIDEFYYGNIDPQESEVMKNKEFKRRMQQLCDTENKLRNNLTGELNKTFEKYCECWSFINSECNRDAFKSGFKLGAKCVFDIFAD